MPIVGRPLICNECGEDVSEFDHAFCHCHDCGECIIFNPQKIIQHRSENPEAPLIIGHNFTVVPAGEIFPADSTDNNQNLSGPRYVELKCLLCCDCMNRPVLKSRPNWVYSSEENVMD